MSVEPDWIDFHGLRAIRLATPDGAQAIVTAHGAHVVSWIARGGEQLYLSDRSRFEAGHAIRGGVPVIFPQFAMQGPLPRHGFARTAEWTLDEFRREKDFASITFRLEDSPQTRTIWPHAFSAEMTVSISESRLDLELEVENADNHPIAFTAALHTYLRVGEVETAVLEGLQGCRLRDCAHGDAERVEREEALVVSDEVDRIYFDVPPTLMLRERGRHLVIQSEGFRDAVVWNPWEEKCAALADMPRDGFRRMLCVEAATIRHPIQLAPGDAWWGRQTLIAT